MVAWRRRAGHMKSSRRVDRRRAHRRTDQRGPVTVADRVLAHPERAHCVVAADVLDPLDLATIGHAMTALEPASDRHADAAPELVMVHAGRDTGCFGRRPRRGGEHPLGAQRAQLTFDTYRID